MAYPQGNASINIDLGIYDSSFSPDNVVAGIIDNHTPVNKLGVRNSIGKELSLLQNYVCQQFLGRYSLPVNSGFINNLRGQENSTIHLGVDVGTAGLYTYSIPGTTALTYYSPSVISGSILSYNYIAMVDYNNITNKYYHTKILPGRLDLLNWDTSGIITVWPNGSGYISMSHGGNGYSERPNLNLFSNGNIRLDTDGANGTVYVSGVMQFDGWHKQITMSSPGNLTLVSDNIIGIWNFASDKSVQLYDSNVELNSDGRIHGFDTLSIDGNGPILINSTRSTWTTSKITLSGEYIDILSPNISLQGVTTISGSIESKSFVSSDSDFTTTLSPNLLSLASGAFPGIQMWAGDGVSLENNIIGYSDTIITATTTLTLKSLIDDIRLFSIPTSDPGEPGQIYRTGGALMISI